MSGGHIAKTEEAGRYIELAANTARAASGAVLVIFDADDDCAAQIGPGLLDEATRLRPDTPIGLVVAVREFESWFLAGADSLGGKRGLPDDLRPPAEPEAVRDAKGWLQARRTDRNAYSPTVDQTPLVAALDLEPTRRRSPSFDKLWREVERLMRETT